MISRDYTAHKRPTHPSRPFSNISLYYLSPAAMPILGHLLNEIASLRIVLLPELFCLFPCPRRELRHYLLYDFKQSPAHLKDSPYPLITAHIYSTINGSYWERFVSSQSRSPLNGVCLKDMLFVAVSPEFNTSHST